MQTLQAHHYLKDQNLHQCQVVAVPLKGQESLKKKKKKESLIQGANRPLGRFYWAAEAGPCPFKNDTV